MNRTVLIVGLLFAAVGVGLAQGVGRVLDRPIVERDLPPDAPAVLPESSGPLPFRMVDLGGVGIEADRSEWGDDYSHHVRRFHEAYLPDPPYIDADAWAAVIDQYRTYVDRMVDLGYNAIAIDGFLELVDFDGVGTDYDIYSEGSPHRAHHAAIRGAYGELFAYARRKGVRVIAKTDMVALTTPLEQYFTSRFGGVDVENPELWAVYQAGFEELLDRFPAIHGLMIRIGEAGAVYNTPGWDYRSELWVRTDASVAQMLRAFLDVAESRDKVVVFRSWSVGVGQVGHIHTDPEAYARVLGDVESDHLVVSTKYPKGDFWSWLPLNPTLFSGPHRRIIEFQARREFEAFNVIPNDITVLYQVALTHLLKRNPRIEGAWVWTQGGGPLRHGPLMIYPFHGPWIWTDANVYGTARILRQPEVDVGAVRRDWVRKTFGDDPAVVETVSGILRDSHEVAIHGLTIPEFGRRHLEGMNVPPVIYSYWDIVGSSTSILSQIYTVLKDELEPSIRRSFGAVDRVTKMREAFARVADRVTENRHWVPWVERSLAYEENLFRTLAHHKAFLLGYYAWLDRGGDDRKAAWEGALEDFRTARDTHLTRHGGNLAFPAYNFEIANQGARIAARTDLSAWTARILLLALVFGGVWLQRGGPESRPRLFWLSLALWILAAHAAFTAYSAPTTAGAMSAFVLVYLIALRFGVLRGTCPRDFGATLMPALLSIAVVLGFVAWRGSTFFWLRFWTDDGARTVLFAACLSSLAVHCATVVAGGTHAVRRGVLAARLLVLVGTMVGLNGLMWAVFGTEDLVTCFNDELLVIPGMTSRVLGLTTHLNIPPEIPAYLMASGLAAAVAGAGLLGLRAPSINAFGDPERRRTP